MPDVVRSLFGNRAIVRLVVAYAWFTLDEFAMASYRR